MKWQCLGIRNHSNYPMIIISKRVYPITIFCGNLFELRAPLHWKIVANTSCVRPKVAKNRAVSEAQGPLLFVVCHSFIVCCHGFLPRFVSSRPGSRVFFHDKKARWSTSLERRLFFCISTLETLNNLWFTTPSLHQIGAGRFSSCRSSPELFHKNLPAASGYTFCTWFAWIWTYYKHPKRHCAKMELMATICNTRR